MHKGILEDMDDEIYHDKFEEFKTPQNTEDNIQLDLAMIKKKKNLMGRDRLYSSSEIIKPHE